MKSVSSMRSSKIGWGLYRAFLEEVDRFEGYIVRGEFDSILIRPWPSLFTLISRNFEINRLSFVMQGSVIMAISVRPLLATGALTWAEVGHLGLACLWTALIFCAVGIATSAAAFVIVSGRTASLHSERDADRFSVSLEIYPNWLKYMLLTVILSVGNYVPVRYLL